jgi:hypothetical protein
MKNLARTASLIVFICLLGINVSGQKQNNKRKLNKSETAVSNSPKAVCMDDAIPKGFVIAAEKPSEKCGGKLELTIKKPSDTEIVCEDSPIPSGFTVMQQQSSSLCQKENTNPLTNALMIKLDGVPTQATNSSNAKSPSRVFEESRAYYEGLEKRAEESRQSARRMANDLGQGRPSSGKIEDAIRQRRIIVGMKKDEVVKAIGRPTSFTKGTNARGVFFEQWYYTRYQGSLFFEGDILTSMVED